MMGIIIYICFVAFVLAINQQHKRNKSHINIQETSDNINTPDNNFELLGIEIDTLHQLDKSIDKMLSECINDKERIQLLNKKATTINKIKRLEKELEKLL
jgi:hypothetical protein